MTRPQLPPPREPHRRAGRGDARVAVSLAGPLLFTPPALAMADREISPFGIPALVLYVFIAWLVGIVLTAALAARDR